jgi:hypothetical protein
MTTYECWRDDPEFCAERDQYDLHDSKSIAKRLRRIDRLRQQLIEAQNDLAALLVGAPQFTRGMFAEFYHGGGVTEADWIEYNRLCYPPHPARDYGQLRAVSGNRQGEWK